MFILIHDLLIKPSMDVENVFVISIKLFNPRVVPGVGVG